MKAEKINVSVAELSASLARDFALIAETKQLSYSVDIDDDCPAEIVTDPQRLGQILNNLLSNAFKFTERGSVKVRIGPAKDGWDRGKQVLASAPEVIALSVTDTGIGMDDQIQARIFEAFAQGDGSTARLYGGTGLGLSISRELTALLEGDLVVQSSPELGSTFTIYLPHQAGPAVVSPASRLSVVPIVVPVEPGVVRGEMSMQATVPLRVQRQSYVMEEGAFGGAKVFVVDDDFRNVFAMKALLERGGAIVTFAENGADAVSMLKERPPVDIVLMDIMMPGMDGYATIRAIRKLDNCKDLPIVAVTGKVMAGERQRCLDAGANDYVPKPVDTGELVAAISPWLPTLVAAIKPWRPGTKEKS